jgi:hypothetical protein
MMHFTSDYAQFRQLGRSDRRALVEASARLALVAIALRIVPFGRFARGMGNLADMAAWTAPRMSAADIERARCISRALRRAARRLPWRSTCLAQALVGQRMLRRSSLPAELTLGVANGEGEFTAHAWLSSGEVPICGWLEAPRYRKIASYVHRPER